MCPPWTEPMPAAATAARRRDRLAATLKAERVEALLITSEANVGYLTGFTGDSSALILGRDRAVMVSDGRYTEQLRAECPDLELHIRQVKQTLIPAAAEAVSKLGHGRLGYEAA